MTHWKKLTNPNYLGTYSIENGKDIVLTIKFVREEMVTGSDGKKEDCVVCYFKENVKPLILNKTNMKTITKLYKTPYIEEWEGKQIQIGIEKVKAFGDIVEALRIRKVIPHQIEEEHIKCTNCENDIKSANNMTAQQIAAYTTQKYGQALCSVCATQKAQEVKNAQ